MIPPHLLTIWQYRKLEMGFYIWLISFNNSYRLTLRLVADGLNKKTCQPHLQLVGRQWNSFNFAAMPSIHYITFQEHVSLVPLTVFKDSHSVSKYYYMQILSVLSCNRTAFLEDENFWSGRSGSFLEVNSIFGHSLTAFMEVNVFHLL